VQHLRVHLGRQGKDEVRRVRTEEFVMERWSITLGSDWTLIELTVQDNEDERHGIDMSLTVDGVELWGQTVPVMDRDVAIAVAKNCAADFLRGLISEIMCPPDLPDDHEPPAL
jgi:hypothetical protein